MNPPVLVPYREIIVDQTFQPRCDGVSGDHVASLMETPEAWPPIVLARVDGRLFLIDGFHRHAAAHELGLVELPATIFDPAEGSDLLSVAFQLNAKHGRPLTLRDRKAYALNLLDVYPDLSDRELGRRSALHHETIGALRNQQASEVQISPRKEGQLPNDVGLLDPIRFAKKATREQKAVAGYVARLAIAMDDPYREDSTLDAWSDDPAEIARACIVAMGRDRATEILLHNLAADAAFVLNIAKAARTLLKEAS